MMPLPVPSRRRERSLVRSIARRGRVGAHPSECIGTREEMAGAADFLAFDESSFATGADFQVEGGTLER